MKIIICGPPHSGKSVLREGLKKAILAIPNASYPYFITACPDGEGAWFQETASRFPEESLKLKEEYKRALGGFTPEFVERVSDSIKKCSLPLTFADIGGILDIINKKICMNATHAIILFNNYSNIHDWRKFCYDLGLKIIAEIYSDYNGKEDSTEIMDGLLIGTVHHLERGVDVSCRVGVIAIAEYLLKLGVKDGNI